MPTATPSSSTPMGPEPATGVLPFDQDVSILGGVEEDLEPLFHEAIMEPPNGRKSEGKTTHEYMSDWMENYRDEYLQTLLDSEGRCAPTFSDALEEMVIRLASLDSKNVKPFDQDPSYGFRQERGELGGGLMVNVVHTNGYHRLPLFPCFCPDSRATHLQLLKAGLYPSTQTETETVFTFQLLKNYHLSTVDSHLSLEHYCSLLRRLTNYTFPSESLERRRELARVSQQYDHLIDLKRNGFGITEIRVRTPGKGELAFFCAVCPQDGLNLPSDWRNLGDQHVFPLHRRISSSADVGAAGGDFGVLGPDTAAWLTDGAHYFAEIQRFGRFLKSVKEKTEPPTCNQLRAIADKNKSKKGYDSTGIVATACTRHGCFAPGSVVDMQKGEKQANADYSISQAYETTKAGDILGLMLAYDINCQFWVRFRQRFESEFLKGSIPPEAAVLFLIGLFHVHGHKEECLPRFAPTFAPGAGMAAGEILESLWAGLNGAANMTKNMTIARRIAVLNACMMDNNWKKFLGMETWINKQHKLAKKGLAAAEKDFKLLNETQMCSARQRRKWKKLMQKAHESRLAGDVQAMDVYKTAAFEAEGQNEVQVRLMHDELEEGHRRGVAEWLASGVRIQEEQLELRAFIKAKRSAAKSGAAAIETEKKRAALRKKLDQFFDSGSELFDGMALDLMEVVEAVERNLCICHLGHTSWTTLSHIKLPQLPH
ncbi:hypothetical protein NMY22_g8249 [Coprinellus aureogranulatus]|nr:hypothetical protein NMY22_g8249 [Coprinellus aureogranulatus]